MLFGRSLGHLRSLAQTTGRAPLSGSAAPAGMRIPYLFGPLPVIRDNARTVDGYRLIARKRDGRVCLFTRRGFDWTDRYPRISAAVAALRPASVTIDGEAVCCDDTGVSVFEKLHSRCAIPTSRS